jgi:hypothetical protein
VTSQLAAVDQMHLEGLAIKREQLRRDNPQVDETQIQKLLVKWLHDRPLDAPGRIRHL